MKLADAIKILDPETTTAEMCRIAEENKMSSLGAIATARQMAVRLMRYAIENKAEVYQYDDGSEHTHCPNCSSDITEHGEGWEFCPFCGQAVKFSEEG